MAEGAPHVLEEIKKAIKEFLRLKKKKKCRCRCKRGYAKDIIQVRAGEIRTVNRHSIRDYFGTKINFAQTFPVCTFNLIRKVFVSVPYCHNNAM